MLDNHIYNLLLQLTQENKSLWRIKNHYKDDTGDCIQCKEFWGKLEKDKEQHVSDLSELIKTHFAEKKR